MDGAGHKKRHKNLTTFLHIFAQSDLHIQNQRKKKSAPFTHNPSPTHTTRNKTSNKSLPLIFLVLVNLIFTDSLSQNLGKFWAKSFLRKKSSFSIIFTRQRTRLFINISHTNKYCVWLGKP